MYLLVDGLHFEDTVELASKLLGQVDQGLDDAFA